MAASSRAKGLKGEREVARIWQAAGFDVRNLEASGDHLVVCTNGVTIHSETKRAERLKLPEWLRQAADEAPQGTVPVVAFRQNRGEWYACLPLDAFASLLGAGTIPKPPPPSKARRRRGPERDEPAHDEPTSPAAEHVATLPKELQDELGE